MEVALQKYNFLSIPQEKIIFIAYNNGKKINYKQQEIYKRERTFNRAMKILCRANIFTADGCGYDLQPLGKFLIRKGLIPLGVKA